MLFFNIEIFCKSNGQFFSGSRARSSCLMAIDMTLKESAVSKETQENVLKGWRRSRWSDLMCPLYPANLWSRRLGLFLFYCFLCFLHSVSQMMFKIFLICKHIFKNLIFLQTSICVIFFENFVWYLCSITSQQFFFQHVFYQFSFKMII